MCNISHIEFKRSMLRRAQSFYLTRPWGFGVEPLMLSKIFERIEVGNNPAYKRRGRVSINSSITLMDFQEDKLVKVTVVPPPLSNPEAGLVSFLSPLGAELIDAKKGDIIKVDFLGARMRFQIVEVH